MRRARLGAAAVAVLSALLCGCAAHAPAPPPVALAAGARPVVALLPLENFSDRAEYADRMTHVVWSAIGRDGRFEIVEPGEVDAVLSDLRIRSAGVLTREQILDASVRLHARWIVAGALLECGSVRTPDGDIPSVSIALRLLDGRSGRVSWTDLRARSGEDRESLFGWGRVVNLEQLADRTARELVASMPAPAPADSAGQGETR